MEEMGEEEKAIPFDEKLMNGIRKYPCIYDKRSDGYHDKNAVQAAWEELASKLNLESAEVAKRRFENVKKRLSKRRVSLMRAERDGSVYSQNLAKHRMQNMKFALWILPYIKPKQLRPSETETVTKSKLFASGATGNSINTFSKIESEGSDNDDSNAGDVTMVSNSRKFMHYTTADSYTLPNTNIDYQIGVDDKETTSLTMSDEDFSQHVTTPVIDINKQDVSFIKKIVNAVIQEKNDDLDIYGMMVTKELRKLSQTDQFLAKHQIQNVLFNFQMKNMLPNSVSGESSNLPNQSTSG